MGRETTSLFDQRVYAQATPPRDTRDGIIWVDTSLADKPTKVYSADTQSFVAVGIADYSQLENRIIGTEVDEYMDGTLGQVESRGFQLLLITHLAVPKMMEKRHVIQVRLQTV